MPLPKAQINGNAVKDWEQRSTPKGHTVIGGRVACSDSRKLEDGSWETISEIFLNVQAWNKTIDPMPAKGDRVEAYGKIRHRHYEDKSGVERTVTELVADYVKVFPRGGGYQQRGQQQQSSVWGEKKSSDPWGNSGNEEPPF